MFAPLLKVGLGAPLQEDPPSSLKGFASVLECRGGAIGALARPRARIEAAAPLRAHASQQKKTLRRRIQLHETGRGLLAKRQL
jgi:hypothetical protein